MTHVEWTNMNALKVPGVTHPGKMIENGWIKQASDTNYHIASPEHLPRLIDHVKKNYPHVESVGVKLLRDAHGGPGNRQVTVR